VGGGVGHVIGCSALFKCIVNFAASELVDWILRGSRKDSVQFEKKGWEQGRESKGEVFGIKVRLVSSGEKDAEEPWLKSGGEGESRSSGISSVSRSAAYSTCSPSFLQFEPLSHNGDRTQLASLVELPASLPCGDSANSAI